VLNWNAGAVANSATNTASFVVDRLVTFTVSNQTAAGLTVDVLPGVVGAAPSTNVLSFGVYNASNTTLDFAITAPTSGSAVTSNISIYADNGDRIFDSSTDAIAATLDNVPADTAFYVFVVGDISSAAVTPWVETIDLLAEALDFATATSLLSDGAANWQAGTVQNVLVDAVGTATGDGLNDGLHSDEGFYLVTMPNLTVSKTATVLADGQGNVAPLAKAIPGATVRYVIQIDNTGTGEATGVTVVDAIPGNTTFVTNSISIGGVADADSSTAPGDYNVSNAGAVTAPLVAPLAAAGSTTVGFSVTID